MRFQLWGKTLSKMLGRTLWLNIRVKHNRKNCRVKLYGKTEGKQNCGIPVRYGLKLNGKISVE